MQLHAPMQPCVDAPAQINAKAFVRKASKIRKQETNNKKNM